MIDLVIPVYNDGANLLTLIKELKKHVKYKVTLLYVMIDDDDLFNYLDEIKKINIEFKLIKNISSGPCEAVKTGIYSGKSNCIIVYPADDFINVKLINRC